MFRASLISKIRETRSNDSPLSAFGMCKAGGDGDSAGPLLCVLPMSPGSLNGQNARRWE